jgi:hypothetical protein
MKRSLFAGVAVAALFAGAAHAADPAVTKGPPAPPPSWWDSVTIAGWVEGSTTINFANPYNKLNFGRLFDDRANTPNFNQAVLTVAKPLDPKATGYDWGFKLQGIVGEDVRYTHYLGELDYAIHSRTQISPLEAHALFHLPWVSPVSEGGIDLKIGQFVTPLGAEVITAPDNPLYSHSYIFNAGPFQHTGIIATDHFNSWLDVFAGVTTGENTSIGWPGDMQNSPSVTAGFAATLLDGKLVINGATHSGPENPKQLDPYLVGWPFGVVGGTPVACACNPTDTWRFLNDVNVTWKPTDSLTFISDAAYYHDNGWNPVSVTGLSNDQLTIVGAATGLNTALIPIRSRGVSGYGFAQYATYKVNDLFKLAGRVEVFRDNNNFFISGFPGYFDSLNLQHGFAIPSVIAAGPVTRGTTYFSITAGVTITPEIPKMQYITGLTIRPELRWDTTLNNTTPFAGGTKRSTVTFGLDAIVPFTIK